MKSKKMTEGFTLVELIVVIAILGILAGVGTVGYSGYIKKANMAADQQLIAGIENAIYLAAYSNDIEGSGYVILSNKDDANIVGAGLEDALVAAFGDTSALKLKYSDWSNNGLQYGLYDAVSVYNSTYYGVADKLMGQVEEITSAAANIVNNMTDGTSAGRDEMIAVFTPDLLIKAADSALGMTLTEDDLKNMDDNEFSNLLVFTASYDIGMKGLYEADGESYEVSQASNLISAFALYNGYAATESGKTVKDASGKTFADRYADFVTAISAADADVDDVKNAYKGLRDATGNYAEYSSYIAAGGQGETDAAAFSAMMMGLQGAASNHGNLKNQLNDPNFFTSGVGKNLFSTYIDSVPSAAGFGEEFMELVGALDIIDGGAVAVYYTKDGAITSVTNSLPVN